ncbi:hypothetical protein L5L91_04435 [Shewanella sp. SM55]|uniref:hypothetical protein n=1 Tax=Shewanella sp. SM55 TaxID=2912800 RepID=UPI0021D9E17A|nr:hypothetical protein [Shewanella sp. SM55]MCU8060022.1 hypothetical protein [Shewanella sp. SM55]
MKLPVNEKITLNALKAVGVIVFVLIYLGMIIHKVNSQQPGFLKTLSDFSQVLGGIAGIIAAYAALIGVYSWRNQIKATVKYSKLVNFRQRISQCNHLFILTTDTSHLLLTMRQCGRDMSEYKTTFELLKQRKDEFKLLTKEIHAEARVIDLLFFGELKYQEATRLAALTDNVSKYVHRYFNLTIYNRDIKSIESCIKSSFEYFELINSQINAYEDRI